MHPSLRWMPGHLSSIRSLLLKQQLPCEEFYEGIFQPFEHFVPLRKDLSDLYEAVLWARAHDEEARAIADKMVARARATLTQETVLQYVHMLLIRYGLALTHGLVAALHCTQASETSNPRYMADR